MIDKQLRKEIEVDMQRHKTNVLLFLLSYCINIVKYFSDLMVILIFYN